MNKEVAQEIFDRAYTGLKGQGFRQARDADGKCVGLASDGTRCAVGHAYPGLTPGRRISDAYYQAHRDLGDDWKGSAFLRALQRAHDDLPSDPDRMQARLAHVAITYGLAIPREGK